MLKSYDEIKSQVVSEWAYFADSPNRASHELADSLVPIYTTDVISEWSSLSWNESDRWHEYGLSESPTIAEMMKTDLFIYYIDSVNRAYQEALEEQAGE